MNILVTGGAGYIGSVLVEYLLETGHRLVVVDDLRQGHQEAVAPGALFVRGDAGDRVLLQGLLAQHAIEAAVHLAAESRVALSVQNPKLFFETNVVKGLSLLEAMIEGGVGKMVFASSAAVYGEGSDAPLEEHLAPLRPVNSYGESKLTFERVLYWYSKAYGLRWVAFRLFNAAGAIHRFGEHHEPESHLLPLLLAVALGQRRAITLFGSDFPTADGTCVRDYVHVLDVARAVVLALSNLGQLSGRIYNLASGRGTSVLQLIEVVRRITGRTIGVEQGERRPGDPAQLVASIEAVRKDLGWEPQHSSLEEIAASAWAWAQVHPNGYRP